MREKTRRDGRWKIEDACARLSNKIFSMTHKSPYCFQLCFQLSIPLYLDLLHAFHFPFFASDTQEWTAQCCGMHSDHSGTIEGMGNNVHKLWAAIFHLPVNGSLRCKGRNKLTNATKQQTVRVKPEKSVSRWANCIPIHLFSSLTYKYKTKFTFPVKLLLRWRWTIFHWL